MVVAPWAYVMTVVAIGVWPVLHVLDLVFLPSEVPQVVGAVSMAVGFAGCALALLRRG